VYIVCTRDEQTANTLPTKEEVESSKLVFHLPGRYSSAPQLQSNWISYWCALCNVAEHVCGMTPSLRSPLQETPLFGILAAEAVRLLATYMFNYLTNADSLLTLRPFSPVTEPTSRVYTYSPTTDQLLCKSGDTKASVCVCVRSCRASG